MCVCVSVRAHVCECTCVHPQLNLQLGRHIQYYWSLSIINSCSSQIAWKLHMQIDEQMQADLPLLPLEQHWQLFYFSIIFSFCVCVCVFLRAACVVGRLIRQRVDLRIVQTVTFWPETQWHLMLKCFSCVICKLISTVVDVDSGSKIACYYLCTLICEFPINPLMVASYTCSCSLKNLC